MTTKWIHPAVTRAILLAAESEPQCWPIVLYDNGGYVERWIGSVEELRATTMVEDEAVTELAEKESESWQS